MVNRDVTPPAPAPAPAQVPWWVVIAVGAAVFFFMSNKTPDGPKPDVPDDPTPSVTRTVGELQLAATCDVFATSLQTMQSNGQPYFATTADVWEAWQYSDRFAFGGVSLTAKEKAWAQAAEIRIRNSLGQAGADTAAVMDPAKAASAAAEFTKLADELRKNGA